jgi:hypothetical protein
MGENYYTKWADGMTNFVAAVMDPVPAALDKAITYATKRPIVHCAGDITWNGATLTWGGTITIVFNREDGQAIANTIAAGSQAIADNEFAYVTLSETNNAALTVSVAAITTGAASNFLTLGILVLAYRNTTNNELYAVHLPRRVRDVDEAVQALTCADSVAVNWANGSTAEITLDRATTTFAFSGARSGQRCVLIIKQYVGGSPEAPGEIAFGAEVRGGTDLAVPPTLSATADLKDYLGFIYNGTDSKYDFVSIAKGY